MDTQEEAIAPLAPPTPLAPWMQDFIVALTQPGPDGRFMTIKEAVSAASCSFNILHKWRKLNPAFDEAYNSALTQRSMHSLDIARDTLHVARTPVAERLVDDALNAPHARDRITAGVAILQGTRVLDSGKGAPVVVIPINFADEVRARRRRIVEVAPELAKELGIKAETDAEG